MKKLLLFLAVFTLFYSCSNETDLPTIKEETVEKQAAYFIDKSSTVDFSAYTEVDQKEMQEVLSTVMDKYVAEGEGGAFAPVNLQPINDYLQFQGKSTIDLDKYYAEGRLLVDSETAQFDEFASFLKKYNMYSDQQLSIFKDFDAAINNVSTDAEYDQLVNSFQRIVDNDNQLSGFEKFSMQAVFGIVSNSQVTVDRGPCWDCIKKKKWKILGWSALWMLPLILACIVATVGAGLVFCIIGVVGAVKLSQICRYCRSVCPWAC